MGMFRQRPRTPSPFGLLPLDELGPVEAGVQDTALNEAVSRRPSVALQPAGAFVGNIVAGSRFRAGTIIALALLGVFVLRAGYLQVAQGATYRALAEANRVRTHILPAERGIITDRNGVVLANNTPSFTLVGRMDELPDDLVARETLFSDVAVQIGADPTQFTDAYNAAGNAAEAVLMLDVPYEAALEFAVHDDEVQGIDIVLGEQRAYITDDLPSLSHVLGYTGIISAEEYAARRDDGYVSYDRIGKQGVEASHEATLRGAYGKETIEVDAVGEYLRTIAKVDPVNGERLTLSIDATLQAQIEYVLAQRLKGTGSERAAVVAMDPRNGEVLALVSWPAYDANLFARGIDEAAYRALLEDENDPLFPRASAGEYPSGSTIKPVFAAAALTDGIITASTSFLSSGGLQIGDRFFPDWRAGGHGVTNVYHAIADSVNTFFYIIGGGFDTFQGMGIDRLMGWAATFGFGSQSGLDIPGEADGFLPTPEWKESETGEPWYIGNTYNVSIGQGDFLVTPVQIARATSVFANNGVLTTPHLVLGQEAATKQVVTDEVAQVIKDAMRRTVTQGSATSLQAVPTEVCGKTGTAQWSRTAPPPAWFAGFAPDDASAITLTVIAEGGGKSSLAIPVAKDILTWYFSR